jgi:UDP:flavonoid glycosyltransferase YjiC (YdhE family)
MTRFLFCTVPVVGHINPGLPIARALIGRGHEVCWYTGRKYQTQVEATGARYEPMRAALDYDDQDLQATFPDLAGRRGLSALKLGIKALSIDSAPGQLEDLQRLLAGFPAEVLVADTAFFGFRPAVGFVRNRAFPREVLGDTHCRGPHAHAVLTPQEADPFRQRAARSSPYPNDVNS